MFINFFPPGYCNVFVRLLLLILLLRREMVQRVTLATIEIFLSLQTDVLELRVSGGRKKLAVCFRIFFLSSPFFFFLPFIALGII